MTDKLFLREEDGYSELLVDLKRYTQMKGSGDTFDFFIYTQSWILIKSSFLRFEGDLRGATHNTCPS